MIEFDWDPYTARANQEKHGISFEQAQSVFFDEYARQFFDEEHSNVERFIMLGLSNACGFWSPVTVSVPGEMSSESFLHGRSPPTRASITRVHRYEEGVRFFEHEVAPESVRFEIEASGNDSHER